MRKSGKNVLVIALLSLAVIIFNPDPGLPVTISIEPGLSTTLIGSSFDVSVSISGITDLYSFQFDVGFDPAIISATGVTEGSFLPAGGSTFFIPGIIDNDAGTISFNADSLIGEIPGVSGSGTLMDITFQALAAGLSPIALSNLLLLDPIVNEISVSPQNGSVEVAPVPEPATLWLLTAGMAALGMNIRRKTKGDRII